MYPEGPVTSPVVESSVGVKRSMNLPSSDYDGYRRLRKMKTESQVDNMLEPGAGYGSSRRNSRVSSHMSSRRSSIESGSSMAPLTRNFARSTAPDLSFIHDSHPYLASRAERESFASSGHFREFVRDRESVSSGMSTLLNRYLFRLEKKKAC